MIKISNTFDRQYAQICGEYTLRDGSKVSIHNVLSVNGLNQIIGLAKYENRNCANIYYRGQTKLYRSMLPSIMRSGDTIYDKTQELNKAIEAAISDVNLLKYLNIEKAEVKIENKKLILEAILQHYGYSTRFLDVVDNHWVALWFGLYEYLEQTHSIREVTKGKTFLDCDCYFKRITSKFEDKQNSEFKEHIGLDAEENIQYLFLIGVDKSDNFDEAGEGIIVGKTTTVIDNRRTIPSIFIRPHAQHSLVVRGNDDTDLSKNVIGILRLRIDLVREWLGTGDLLKFENLFPNPDNDPGFKFLLERSANIEMENMHPKNKDKIFGKNPDFQKIQQYIYLRPDVVVSIVMPTYNCGKFISHSIESILNQKFKKWELIIIDDCSTDNTEYVVKNYLTEGNKIRYHKLLKNSGPQAARNKGIELAKGKYIAFCDSDDIWLPDKLEKQIKFMEINDSRFSATAYEQIDEQGESKGVALYPPRKTNYCKMLRLSCPIGNSTVIYDQISLGKIFVPDIRKRNDFALWLQVLKKCEYCDGIQEILVKYRVRKRSVSSNKIKLIKYHWQLYKEIESLGFLRSMFYILCWGIIKGTGFFIDRRNITKESGSV